MSVGAASLIDRLQNSTPGTSSASAQWSALQAEIVVQQHVGGQLAQAGRPRRTITARVADDQIGGQGRRIARIDLVGAINARGSLAAR